MKWLAFPISALCALSAINPQASDTITGQEKTDGFN